MNKDFQYVLFGPGPVNLHADVRYAATHIDLSHRQEEFIEIILDVKNNLRQIAKKSNSHISILHGSGGLAVEAALQSLVRGKVLVVNNGDNCQRIVDSLRLMSGVYVKELKLAFGIAPSLELISSELNKEYDWICLVHHETSTGLLNPLSSICDIAENINVKVFVDAVSSFGAHVVDCRSNVICFNSNKCLESIPGLAIVVWDNNLSF